MKRKTRVQAVILHEDKFLVLKHFNHQNKEEYCLLPGGGLDEGESIEEGLLREIKEETNLDIIIDSIFLDEPGRETDGYFRFITFLCKVKSSLNEMKKERGSKTEILDFIWCPISDIEFNEDLLNEQIYPSLKRIIEYLRNS